MARRVIFKEDSLSQSQNPSSNYRFVGYDGLTFSQLDYTGEITPIGGGNGGGSNGADNGLSLSGNDVILGGSLIDQTNIQLSGNTFSMINGVTGIGFSMYDDNSTYGNVGGFFLGDTTNPTTLDFFAITENLGAFVRSYEKRVLIQTKVNSGADSHSLAIYPDPQSIGDGSTDNHMIIDDYGNKGLVYADNYTANFTTHSLVTKGYVDTGTSSIWSSINNNAYQYTEVNISSAQLLDIGATPVTLLSAPGSNKYYDFDKIIFEFTYGGVAYNSLAKQFIIGYATPTIKIAYIDLAQLVSQTTNRISIVEPTKPDVFDIGGSVLVNTHISVELNEALIFTTIGAENLTTGTGIMKVKIWYKVRNFG